MKNIKKFEDFEYLSMEVAKVIYSTIEKNPHATLILPTGRTPVRVYEYWIKLQKERPLNLENIKTYNLDEYLEIENSDPRSFHSFMDETLFKKLKLKRKQTFFPDPKKPEQYDEMLNRGVDLCLLGVGVNGHIAFNEPGSEIDDPTRIVDLTEKTLESNAEFFGGKDNVPKKAVTMGPLTILKSKRIILLTNTLEKTSMVMKVLSSGKVISDCPVSYLITSDNPDFYLKASA